MERQRRLEPSRTLGIASSSWSAQQARGERPCLAVTPPREIRYLSTWPNSPDKGKPGRTGAEVRPDFVTSSNPWGAREPVVRITVDRTSYSRPAIAAATGNLPAELPALHEGYVWDQLLPASLSLQTSKSRAAPRSHFSLGAGCEPGTAVAGGRPTPTRLGFFAAVMSGTGPCVRGQLGAAGWARNSRRL